MNYTTQLLSLLREERKAKEILNFFIVFPLIPLFALKYLLVGLFFIYDLFYTFLFAPVSFLENWQKELFKEVRHATEAVIMFITMPFLFIMRIILSLWSFSFSIIWFVIMCLSYITTLGEIKWQPHLLFSSFEEKEESSCDYKCSDKVIITYISITFILALFAFAFFLLKIFYPTILSFDWFYTLSPYIFCLYALSIFIVNPIIFQKSYTSITVTKNTAEKPNKSTTSEKGPVQEKLSVTTINTSEQTPMEQNKPNDDSQQTLIVNSQTTPSSEPERWRCKKCGYKNPSSLIYCKNCGTYK